MGNTKSNAIYNPDPKKHPPPLTTEDQDSNMERHIRGKYEYQTFRREQPAGTSPALSSSSGHSAPTAPAPPTKSKSKFGLGIFRTSASNTKASQILGTEKTPYTDGGRAPFVFPHGMAEPTQLELYGDQIRSLREMGFTDVAQCVKVLEETGGKMMAAVEILIRLNKAEERRPAPPPKNEGAPAGFGLAVHRTGPPAVSRHRTGGSLNPFDALDKEEPPLPPLPSARTGPSAAPTYGHPQALGGFGATVVAPQQWGQLGLAPLNTNPFGQLPQQQQQQQYPAPSGGQQQLYPTQQQQLYPTLTGGQQQQPLFSANTGGSMPSGASYNPFMALQPQSTGNPYQEHLSPNGQQQFFQNQQQPQFQQHAQFQQPQQQQQTQFQQPQPQQAQFQQAQQPAQFQPALTQQQGQFQQPQQQGQFQQLQPQQQLQFQPQQPQLTQQNNPYLNTYGQQQFAPAAVDKSQILALFNAPQLAPPRSENPVEVMATPQPVEQQPVQPPTPHALSKNPFLPQQVQTHVRSQESVDFGAWQSGRHSPDAFANLAFGGR